MSRHTTVFVFLSLGAAIGVALAFIAPEPDVTQTIEWLDNPRSLENFSLDTEAGEFNNQSLKGHWTVVTFGFLHCPDVCPTSLSQMATLIGSLADEPVDQEVNFVFVSVDPGRDSVADVSRYVRHFDESIRGVTGKEFQLAQFANSLGIQFKVSGGNGDYSVAHSTTFSIIDPNGVFRGRFRPGFDVNSLVNNLTTKL